MNPIPSLAGALSYYLAPSIWNPLARFALIEVTAVKPDSPPLGDQERGVVSATVVLLLRGERPAAREQMEFPFERLGDPEDRRNAGFDPWNWLPLQPGANLLVACVPVDVARGQYRLIAAQPVDGPNSLPVVELRRSLDLHLLKDQTEKIGGLRQALVEGRDVLRQYALLAIGTHGAVPRPSAVRLVIGAIAVSATLEDDDLELASSLIESPFYDETAARDDSNEDIVSALARGFVAASTADRKSRWLTYLCSRVMREYSDDAVEDRRLRTDLIRAVSSPPARQVQASLGVYASAGAMDGALASQLSLAWGLAQLEKR